MAHHGENSNSAIEQVLEILTEHGLEAMATAMQTLMNEAMKIERSEFLRASPGERSSERIGHANEFKPKSVRSRVGEFALRVPQLRPLPGGEQVAFYPRSLERGLRSERALKLAIADMYVQGVSTRRVTEITRELCGLDVTSSQVSRAAAELDEELSAWRERPLGRCAYLLLDARYEKVRHGVRCGTAPCWWRWAYAKRRASGCCSASRCRCRRPRCTGGRSSSRCSDAVVR
jgi:transposase-like protein